MNVLVIEDEMPAYRRLAKLIQEVLPEARLEGPLESIESVRTWVATNPAPQLVFCDIHLADGSAFEMLRQVDLKAPIIFTTAYDEYALEAFKTSGIDYLLKPVKKEELNRALQKLSHLKQSLGADTAGEIMAPNRVQETKPAEYRSRFAIRFGERLLTLMVEDLAYCFSENKATFARTFDGRTYPLDHNLDTLELQLNPEHFFRLNRQFLIHIKAIADMRTHTKARVIVTLEPPAKEAAVVSSERASAFKAWIAGER
jgi:DNA-binding LytR/AlgR family response regulator